MEAFARAPDPLPDSENMAKSWARWKEELNAFMKITGYDKLSSDIRANFLKNRIGPIGLEAIENLSFEYPMDKDDINILISKLDLYFDPNCNEVMQRFKFFSAEKKNNVSFKEFVRDLEEKAEYCNFGEMKDSLIRDKVILHARNKELQQRLLRIPNLDLSMVISICSEYEAKMERQKLQNSANTKTEQQTTQSVKNPLEKQQMEKDQQSGQTENRKCCWRCGKKHAIKNCSAWGHKCEKCGQMNHLSTQCRNTNNISEKNQSKGKNLFDSTNHTKKDSKDNNFKQKANTHPHSNVYIPPPPFLDSVRTVEDLYSSSTSTFPSAPIHSLLDDTASLNLNRIRTEQCKQQNSTKTTGNNRRPPMQFKPHPAVRSRSANRGYKKDDEQCVMV